jgi:hypothetical protein
MTKTDTTTVIDRSTLPKNVESKLVRSVKTLNNINSDVEELLSNLSCGTITQIKAEDALTKILDNIDKVIVSIENVYS